MIGTNALSPTTTSRNEQEPRPLVLESLNTPQKYNRNELPYPVEEIDAIEAAILADNTHYNPQQKELLLDLVTSIKVLDAQIQNAKNLPNFDISKFKTEIENLKQQLYTVDAIPTQDSLETSKSIVEVQNALKKESRTFEILQDIKGTTAEITKKKAEPVSSREQVKELQNKLSNRLTELIKESALSENEKDQLIRSVPEAVKEVTKQDSNKRLNMFQKVLVWFNVKVLKKDYEWLNGYLQKSAFKDTPAKKQQSEVNSYIKENYQEVYHEADKKGIIKKESKVTIAEPLPSTQTIEPLTEAKRPKIENVPIPSTIPTQTVTEVAPKEASVDRSVYYQELKDSGRVESVLKTIEKVQTKEGQEIDRFADAQEKINIFLDELVEDERQMPPLQKVQLVTHELMHRIVNQDMQVNPENIDGYYERILNKVDPNDKELYFKIREEIRINRGTIKTLIEQRRDQCNYLMDLVESAKLEVTKTAATNAEKLTAAQFEEQVSRTVTAQMMDTISSYYIEQGLIPAVEATAFKEKMQLYVAKGVIQIDFVTDKTGGGYPLITTREYIDEQGIRHSAKAILNEATGGKAKPDNELAAGYQFTINRPEFVENNDTSESGTHKPRVLKNNALHFISAAIEDESYDVKTVIRHEYIHAVNAAKKEASLAALRTRMTNITINNSAFDSVVKEIGLPEDEVAEALQEYLFGSNRMYPLANISNRNIAGYISQKFDTLANTSIDELQQDQENKKVINYLKSLEKRRDFYLDKVENGWGRPLDEVAAKAGDATEFITLADINVNKFELTNEVHRTTLGLTRLINNYVELRNETAELNTKERNELENRQAFLGTYFGTGLGSEMEEASAEKIITSLIDASKADLSDDSVRADTAILKLIHEDLHHNINNIDVLETLQNSYLSFIKATSNSEEPIDQGKLSLLNESIQELLKPNIDEDSRREIVLNIKRAFPNINLPYLNILNADTAFLINYFIDPPQDYEVGEYRELSDDPADRLRNSSHPFAPIRHSVRQATNAYLYGHRKKGTYTGAADMGDKVDLFFRVNHPKDQGPRILRWGGIDRKLWVDSFGFGTDEFRTDSNDGLEGLYFATGLPFHKIPALQNLPGFWKGLTKHLNLPEVLTDLDKKAFAPKSILLPSVTAYSTGVIRDIYNRVLTEKQYDAQALVRLVVELGGFRYDAQGQPHEERTTYSTENDNYRLNTDLAAFLAREKIGGQNEADRNQIIARMQTDRLMDVNGNYINVVMNNGQLFNADTQEEIKGFEDHGLTIGQISASVLDEIREIMVYGPSNAGLKKPAWELGVDMKRYDAANKTSRDNLNRWNNFKKLGEAMMRVDAMRRAEGKGSYTIADLILEIERADNMDIGELRNPDGTINRKMVNRYTKHTICIGVPGKDEILNDPNSAQEMVFSIEDAKDFIKEFSLARSQKVLSVGVWERAPIIAQRDNEMIPPLTDQDEIAQIIHNINVKMSTNDPSVKKIVTPKGVFLVDGARSFFVVEDRFGRRILYETDGTKLDYNRHAKLSFEWKQQGTTIEFDPINPLPEEILRRYFGEAKPFQIKDANGNLHTITGRQSYDTEQGQMFDDVYDTLEKIKKGKDLSYKFSVKLYSTDKYRDMSKVQMEFYNGLLNIEKGARKIILLMSIAGMLVPGLAFLANPVLMVGTVYWSLLAQPFLARAASGWQKRMMAAIEAADAMMSASASYYKLVDETNPPSFGELNLMNAQFENVKFKYRSVLKDFSDGAKWNSNEITNVFSSIWDKVANKPPIPI